MRWVLKQELTSVHDPSPLFFFSLFFLSAQKKEEDLVMDISELCLRTNLTGWGMLFNLIFLFKIKTLDFVNIRIIFAKIISCLATEVILKMVKKAYRIFFQLSSLKRLKSLREIQNICRFKYTYYQIPSICYTVNV